MEINKEKFARRFKQLREKMGIKQKELAAMLDVKRSTVGSWEAAHRLPEIQKAQKAADFFGVTIDYLLGKSDDPKLKAITDPEMLRELEEIQRTIDEAVGRFTKIMEKHMIKKEISPS